MVDARFEDGRETPLNLGAVDEEDLRILASLVQDAVFPTSEMKWDRANGRFVVLLNRFRWEDSASRKTAPERVQSLLTFENVHSVATSGIDRADVDVILSVLTISFEPNDAPSGHVLLVLAGDGAIRLGVEAIDVSMKDVTKPYVAPSKKTPSHPD